MDNKDYFERTYKVNNDCALKYVQQKNWAEARRALEKAGEAIVKLASMSYGAEKERYISKAKSLRELLQTVKERDVPQKPQASSVNANAAKSEQKKADDKAEEPRPKPTVEEALARLNELIGLDGVKKEVETLTAELEMKLLREKSGLKGADTTHHLVFAGSPGTGKTTVARIMADILYSLGAIEKGQLVEVGREDLVAGYVGQTGLKTQKAVEDAMGGVLFIDEVYRLGEGGENDFGKEAVGVLLKAVEDCRGEFVVILAGYDSRMQDFFKLNPGLISRFPNTIHFTDYTPDEMYRIFEGMCTKNQYVISPQLSPLIKEKLSDMYRRRDENFGHARDVRNVYEKIIKKQNLRLYQLKKSGAALSKEMLMTVLPEDFV